MYNLYGKHLELFICWVQRSGTQFAVSSHISINSIEFETSAAYIWIHSSVDTLGGYTDYGPVIDARANWF